MDCNAYIFSCVAWAAIFENRVRCLPSGVDGEITSVLQQEFWTEMYRSMLQESTSADDGDFRKSSMRRDARVRKYLQSLRSTGQNIPYRGC